MIFNRNIKASRINLTTLYRYVTAFQSKYFTVVSLAIQQRKLVALWLDVPHWNSLWDSFYIYLLDFNFSLVPIVLSMSQAGEFECDSSNIAWKTSAGTLIRAPPPNCESVYIILSTYTIVLQNESQHDKMILVWMTKPTGSVSCPSKHPRLLFSILMWECQSLFSCTINWVWPLEKRVSNYLTQ